MANSPRAARLMKMFGRRLRAARIMAGYQDAGDFARDLAIEGQRYRKYERGAAMPPLDLLENIIDLTGQSCDFLLLGRKASA